MKKFLVGLLVFSLTLTVFHTYLGSQFPYTNDGENHLARFANYKIALKEGQFPPRFAPNLLNHYGYPVFNFNYPLANILSLPFSAVKINPESTFKILSIIFYIFGLFGMYKLAQIHKSSLFVSIMSMILFGLNPYIVNVVLFRGSIGELFAISFLPWLIWSIEAILRTSKISVLLVMIWTGFLLSHNVTVLIATGWLFPYLLFRVGKNFQFWRQFLAMFVMACCLSAWFWIPALLEANQTVVQEAGIAKQLVSHTVTITQLLFGQLRFGFSYASPVDSLGFQLGYPHILVLMISTLVISKLFIQTKKVNSLSVYLVTTAFLLIILQLNISSFFWQTFPFLKIIQFPWRLSILLVIITPLLWVDVAQHYGQSLKRLLVVSVIIYAFVLGQLKPVDFFHHSIIEYDLFSQSTSTQNENRTKEFTYLEIGDWEPIPKIIGNGVVTVESWTGSTRNYTLRLTSDSTIIEPTMNFSGWRSIVTNAFGEKFTATYISDDQVKGRIAFSLPPGEYSVSSYFSQRTPARIFGNTLTIIAVFVCVLIAALELRNKKNLNKHV